MKIINRSILFFLLVSVMSLHAAVITTLDDDSFGSFGSDAAWLESGGTTYLAVGGSASSD